MGDARVQSEEKRSEVKEHPVDPRASPGLEWKETLSWSLYDWANSAFAATVMAVFFPVFFQDFWSTGVRPEVTSSRLGTTIALASVVVALLALLLGGIADRGKSKK